MGHFRFRRSIGNKFFRLNVSKSGLSMTSGVPGAHLNTPLVSTRKRKAMATLSIPGTGLSYRQQLGSETGLSPQSGSNLPIGQQALFTLIGIIVVIVMTLVFS